MPEPMTIAFLRAILIVSVVADATYAPKRPVQGLYPLPWMILQKPSGSRRLLNAFYSCVPDTPFHAYQTRTLRKSPADGWGADDGAQRLRRCLATSFDSRVGWIVAHFDGNIDDTTVVGYHAIASGKAERTALAFQLELRRLTKSVPGGRVLFRDLTLRVAAGELVAIVGESGSGKSTLLNIAAGLDSYDAGQVLIGGDDLGAMHDRALTDLRRRRIGFVFQAFHILPYLTLRRNVAMPLALAGCDSSEIIARADAMLDRVGLGQRGDDYARDLSGGELQRVAIARALIHRPALILADEPTGNLDAETATRILQLFADSTRNSGSAGLLVTHSAAAAAIADRTLVLTTNGLSPAPAPAPVDA